MSKVLIAGINQVATDKGLDREVIFQAIEAALVSAYKRNYGSMANVDAHVDRMTGDMRILAEREVVDDIVTPRTEINLAEARKSVPEAQLGDVIKVETKPDDFGRIAAQTAKQVILQRIREAERDTVYENFAHKVGEILTAQVRSVDTQSGAITLLLNEKHEVLMMREEQIPTEKSRRGDFVKVYVVDVHKSTRGPVIKLSRTHRNLLRRLMEQEIPEVRDGVVEIKAIAREPGARSKAAVIATVPNVDPVGSCVGMRGLRIQNIVNELSGEKIDVIEWSNDPGSYITNALSPAKPSYVLLDEKSNIKTAVVVVPDRQLSLAIGKEGQNARLAAKLTGWRIDIKSESEAAAEGLDRLVAERAMRGVTKQQGDLLSVAERLLKGGDKTEDRLWQAAQTLQDGDSTLPVIAEQGGAEEDSTAKVKRKVKTTKPTKVEAPADTELAEGLPAELAPLTDVVAAVSSAPSTKLSDAFERSLAAVQSEKEPELPSEEPFREEIEKPAPAADEPLPQVITADMLRARMAQRKQQKDTMPTEIEVPESLLAGYVDVVPDEEPWEGEDADLGKAKKTKKGVVAKAPEKKAKKKKWHPAEGDGFEDFY